MPFPEIKLIRHNAFYSTIIGFRAIYVSSMKSIYRAAKRPRR